MTRVDVTALYHCDVSKCAATLPLDPKLVEVVGGEQAALENCGWFTRGKLHACDRCVGIPPEDTSALEPFDG